MRLFTSFFAFIAEIYTRRSMLIQLAKRDFKSRYLGSAFGLFWGYVQPTITILILIFVFEVGFRAQPLKDVPYVLWFVTGMIPWFFISEAIQSGTGAILEYSFLVKKIAFRVSLLPIIKIISAFLIHIFFVFGLFILFYIYKFPLGLESLQVFYYLFSAIVLLLGVSWITSALIVFLKDVGQIVTMFLGFGFWLTPIMWDISSINPKYQFYFKLNPAFYIIDGYRQSLIYRHWFWEGELLTSTLIFWFISLLIFVGGAVLFRQLKPHFADVI